MAKASTNDPMSTKRACLSIDWPSSHAKRERLARALTTKIGLHPRVLRLKDSRERPREHDALVRDGGNSIANWPTLSRS